MFFTSEHIHLNLLSWKLWRRENAHQETILPYYETGHPDPIDLRYITKILKIIVNRYPDSFANLQV